MDKQIDKIKNARKLLNEMIKVPNRETKEYEIWLKKQLDTDTTEFTKQIPDELSYLKKNIYKKKRKEALQKYITSSAPLYDDIDIEPLLFQFFKPGMPVMDLYARDQYVDCAIAIYILEQLRMNGTLETAADYLRFDEQVMNTPDLIPEGLIDSSFETVLIKAMVFLIRFRNDTYTFPYYYNEETIARHTTGNEIHIQKCRPDECQTNRQRFDNIIGLLPIRAIEHSAILLAEMCEIIDDMLYQIQQRFTVSVKPYINRLNGYFNAMEKGQYIPPEQAEDALFLNDKIDRFIAVKNREISCIYGLEPDVNVLSDSDIKFCYKNLYKRLPIKDPYELLFAEFLQIDLGVDNVWCWSMHSALVIHASDLLPWSDFPVDSETLADYTAYKLQHTDWDELLDDNEAKFLYDRKHNFHFFGNDQPNPNDDDLERIDMKDIDSLLEIVDQLTTDDLLDLTIMLEDAVNYNPRVNLTQYIYRKSGYIMPRYTCEAQLILKNEESLFEDEISEILLKEIIQLATRTASKQTIGEYRLKSEYGIEEVSEQELTDEILPEEQNDVQKDKDRISALQDENRKLKEVLHDVDRSNLELRNKIAELESAMRIEHEELSSLRELAYNMGEEDEEPPRTSPKKGISYPYKLKKRTVIVGGHDTWLAPMRKMFPNATYILPGKKIDPNLILYADMVWVQNNAIPHSQFYALTSLLQKHRKPLYYFSFASADKCAEQLVEKDIKE